MKRVLLLLLVAMMVFSVVACESGDKNSEVPTNSGASEPAAEEKKEFDFVYLSPSTESQYWQQVGIGVENAVLDLEEQEGVKINFSVVGSATEAESDAYLKAYENTIAKKPDAIVTATLHPDATGMLTKEAFEQGIAVNFVSMGIDQDQWGDYYGVHYYCDNNVIGEVAAKTMLDGLAEKGIEPKGKIGIHMSVVVPVLEARMDAFKAYMDENAPDIECLTTLYNENDVNNAQANVENQISTYVDLIGLYGANNVSGDGIALGIQNSGKTDKLVGIGVDADDLEVQALREGNLYAIIVQTPYEQGYNCVIDAYKTVTTGELPAEQEVDISSQAITKANMDEEEFAALLDPFILKRK